jgi:hypothetical protein
MIAHNVRLLVMARISRKAVTMTSSHLQFLDLDRLLLDADLAIVSSTDRFARPSHS